MDSFDRAALVKSVDAKLHDLLWNALQRYFGEHGGLAIYAPKDVGSILDANGNVISFGDWVLTEYETGDGRDTISGYVAGPVGECFEDAGLWFELDTASQGWTHRRYIKSLGQLGLYIAHQLHDLDDAALQDFEMAWSMALLKTAST